MPVALVKAQFTPHVRVPAVAKISTPVTVVVIAAGALPFAVYPVIRVWGKLTSEPAVSYTRKYTASVFVKVVLAVIPKFPPTRYVPAGSTVDGVRITVDPFPADTLVLVFTRIGGVYTFTADGATFGIEVKMVAIYLSARKGMRRLSW